MSIDNLTEMERFESLTLPPPYQVRFIGESLSFYQIIKKMREIFSEIYQPEADPYDNENESALLLRMEMTLLQISPKPPSQEILRVCKLDDKNVTSRQWGDQLTNRVSELEVLISNYNEKDSLLDTEFIRVFTEIYQKNKPDSIKIFCRPKERKLFIELLRNFLILEEKDFITNLTEYRNYCSLEALFCYGPFRQGKRMNIK